jgi:RNA polymerase sigma factor (sigma-70 family)
MPELRALPTSTPDHARSSGVPGVPRPVDPVVALARAAAAGDLAAAARVLEAVAPRVGAAVAAVMGREHADVDDVTQQALIALLQALPAFRGECHPASYASRIAVRTAVNSRQASRRRHARHERISDFEHQLEAGCAPGEDAGATQRKQIVRDLLEELPSEQAESLALRVVLGWSLDEVASATGAPLNTVRSRIRLAKEALRRKIEAVPGLVADLEVSL